MWFLLIPIRSRVVESLPVTRLIYISWRLALESVLCIWRKDQWSLLFLSNFTQETTWNCHYHTRLERSVAFFKLVVSLEMICSKSKFPSLRKRTFVNHCSIVQMTPSLVLKVLLMFPVTTVIKVDLSVKEIPHKFVRSFWREIKHLSVRSQWDGDPCIHQG